MKFCSSQRKTKVEFVQQVSNPKLGGWSWLAKWVIWASKEPDPVWNISATSSEEQGVCAESGPLKNSPLGKPFTYVGKYVIFFIRSWNLLSLGPGKQFYSLFVFYCPYLSIFLWLCCFIQEKRALHFQSCNVQSVTTAAISIEELNSFAEVPVSS